VMCTICINTLYSGAIHYSDWMFRCCCCHWCTLLRVFCLSKLWVVKQWSETCLFYSHGIPGTCIEIQPCCIAVLQPKISACILDFLGLTKLYYMCVCVCVCARARVEQ
jgi:hypothetical protein